MRGMARPTSDRGAALGVVVIMAVTAAIGAYVILLVATSRARQQRVYETRTENRYLAEAGVVIARERLGVAAGYTGGTYYLADTNGDGLVNASDTPVQVTVAGNQIQSRAD